MTEGRSKKQKDFTKGPILKSLVALALPIVFANILQSAYQFIDTFWVGRLGADAVAAVSLSFPIIFLLISVGIGLSIAGTILVSQYKGSGNKEKVDYVSGQTLTMVLIVSIIVAALGYFISAPIMNLMGPEKSVLIPAIEYLKISFLGIPFVFLYVVFQSLIRGVGEVKLPVYIVFTAVLLNLVLDPLFILGYGPIPAFGVSGAALATIGTQGIATLIGIIVLVIGKHGIKLRLKNLKPNFKMLNKIFKLGLPASLSFSTRALGMALMAFLVATFGSVVVASYGIGGQVVSFVIILGAGLSMATSTLVGQNIGASKIERAEKVSRISTVLSFSFLTILGVFIFIFAKQLITIFIPDDPEVIDMGTDFVKTMALTFGFIGVQQSINGTFTGSGNTFQTMLLTIITLWVIQFPLAYILSKHTSLAETGIWLSIPIANVLGGLIAFLWYKKGTWKEKRIIEHTRA